MTTVIARSPCDEAIHSPSRDGRSYERPMGPRTVAPGWLRCARNDGRVGPSIKQQRNFPTCNPLKKLKTAKESRFTSDAGARRDDRPRNARPDRRDRCRARFGPARHGRLPSELGPRLFRLRAAELPLFAGNARLLSFRRERVSGVGRRVARDRPSRRPALGRVPSPACDRSGRGGAGERRDDADGAGRDDLVRHPALHLCGEPARGAFADSAGVGRAGRGRRRARGAAGSRQRRVQSARAGVVGPRNRGPVDVGLASAAALGRRHVDRIRADAAGPAVAARLEARPLAARTTRPRRGVRRPAQPHDLSRPSADFCLGCCSLARNCPAKRRGTIASATSRPAAPPASKAAATSRLARKPANASQRKLSKKASSLRWRPIRPAPKIARG